MIYRILFRLVLRHIPPEAAHRVAERMLAILGRTPGFRSVLRALLGTTDPRLSVTAFGLTFPTPLGVAAGLDKNLTWFEELAALGFGFVEVGTVTALPQPGNPRPRLHRLVSERALINRMGFPNRGAAAAAERLRARDRSAPNTGTVVAVNVGRSRAATDVAEDYRRSVAQVAPWADMLVLNVSSPNTPGLRDLQAAEPLGDLIAAVREELTQLGSRVPLLIKISPDLDDAELDAIARLALRLQLDGIVAVNTTTTRPGLGTGTQELAGGLSGRPLKARSLEVLRRLRALTGDQLVLVSVGGVETWRDVLERIRAGATLVQAYTGFVYGGPLWPRRINRALSAHLRAHGVATVQELIGIDAGDAPRPAATPTEA
jgi:dihydroorotate dehydrogenase